MKKLIGLGLVVAALVPSLVWGKIGGGDIVFHPSGAANVLYSHDIHVGKLGLKCGNCHNSIYMMSTKTNKKTPMADMQKGESCGACHNGKKAFDVKQSCTQCHKE